MPQVTAGRLPAHGGTQRLPRLVGRMRALDLLLTCRAVDATEAEAIGLVSRVAPPGRFARALDIVVAELQSKGPIALRYAKEAVLKGSDLTLDQGVRLEEDLYVLLQTTHDRQEGIAAFLEKRQLCLLDCALGFFGDGEMAKVDAELFRDRFEIRVIAHDERDLARKLSRAMPEHEIVEAVVVLGDEDRHAWRLGRIGERVFE